MSWTPLFSEITESSVWMEPQHVRLAWITFLAKKDYKEHTYETNPYLLAKAANITEAEAEDAIRVLLAPDRKSRSQEHEGRRLMNLGGNLYRVLSGERYLEKMRKAKKREADRLRQEDRRAEPPGKSDSPWHVAFGLDLPESLRTQGCLGAVKVWLAHKSERNDAYKPTGLRVALAKWAEEFTPEELSAAIRESIANNWKGVFRKAEKLPEEAEYTGPNLG